MAVQHALITKEEVRRLVEQYFDYFNEQAFEQAAALFGQVGRLRPPFDPVLVGSEAIATYLSTKAQNMKAFPNQWQILSPSERVSERTFERVSEGASEAEEFFDPTKSWQVEVKGQVQAAFRVNIVWQFIVNAKGDIDYARIKLLASPNELLNLRAFAV